MRILVLLLASLFFLSRLPAEDEPLNLAAIKQLIDKGFGDDVVIAAIKAAKAVHFDTSAQGLVAMKDAGISDAVVKLIIERQAATAIPPPVSAPTPANVAPNSEGARAIAGLPAELGIYYRSGQAWIRLEEQSAETHSTRRFTTRITGIGSLTYKAIYRGAKAEKQLPDSLPTFYIRAVSGSVSGLVIYRLDEKKNHRERPFASMNTTEFKTAGAASLIRVAVSEVSEKIYSLVPRTRLEPGEYVLTVPGAQNGYDFGITAPQ